MLCCAAHGDAVLCRLYQKLDWLMLLAEGHLMYYGKADQVGIQGLGYAPRVGWKSVFSVQFSQVRSQICDLNCGRRHTACQKF